MKNTLCPCGTNLPYTTCCKPYHDGLPPLSALALMRSRYSAYALSIDPAYLIETTHPKGPQYQQNKTAWRKQISQFSKETIFNGLTILGEKQEMETAYVTFHASLVRSGKDVSFTECSFFKKEEGKWLYYDGMAGE